MRFVLRNTYRSIIQNSKEIGLILFNMILCSVAVFVFLQNYEYSNFHFKTIYEDETVASNYLLSMDEEDADSYANDVLNETPMYRVGKKVLDEISSNSDILFYDTATASFEICYIENGEKLEAYQAENESVPLIETDIYSQNVMKAYGLEIDEGREFSPEDFTNYDKNKPVSVILGYDYKDIYKVGDTIRYHEPDNSSNDDTAVVIGFLKKRSYYSAYNNIYYLDSHMIFPLIFPRYDGETYDGEKFAFDCWIHVDDPNLDLQSFINDISAKNGFYTLMVSPENGIEKSETEDIARKNVALIGTLAAVGSIICTLALGTIIYNRSIQNRTKYCIFMCYGIPMWKINLSIFLEMVVLLCISVFPAVGLSILQYGALMVPAWQILVFTLPIILIALIPTFVVNHKCNIDILIRDKIV